MTIFPAKLNKGDEVRVIAPSCSLKMVSQENIDYARHALEKLGLKVSYGKNVNRIDIFNCSPIESRIEDLHAAFSDQNVKAILTAKGGSNANQLLEYINYELIRNNPKIFCGYSDITVLQNAIYSKTGLVTYSGMHFSSFAMQKGLKYCLEYFQKIFFDKSVINISPSESWSDDVWLSNQDKRTFYKNSGYIVINPGEAQGTIVGGNLCSLQLLHGTCYMPSIKDSILFIEADAIAGDACVVEFDRDLQSLIHQPEFDTVKALVIGRFESKFGMDLEKLKQIINSKRKLKNIPVIANADFGHTMPIFTFPIGGSCKINAIQALLDIQITEH